MVDGREQRKSERHTVRFHLVYDDGSSFNAGVVRDVSEGGLFLETALPLPVGTEVRLTPLDQAGETLFEVRARVMRANPYDPNRVDGEPSGMGLQFLDLGDTERKSVVIMIRSLEERAATFEGERDPYLGVMVPRSASQLGMPPPDAADAKPEDGDESADG